MKIKSSLRYTSPKEFKSTVRKYTVDIKSFPFLSSKKVLVTGNMLRDLSKENSKSKSKSSKKESSASSIRLTGRDSEIFMNAERNYKTVAMRTPQPTNLKAKGSAKSLLKGPSQPKKYSTQGTNRNSIKDKRRSIKEIRVIRCSFCPKKATTFANISSESQEVTQHYRSVNQESMKDLNSSKKLFQTNTNLLDLPKKENIGNNVKEAGKEFPMLAAKALTHFADSLTEGEKKEMEGYDTVYFMGNRSAAKTGSKRKLQIGDHIAYRYEVIKLLGKGTFGQVLQCKDHKVNQMVALKIISNKKKGEEKARNEIKILERIKRHDASIVKLLETFVFRKHTCIVLEMLDASLYEFLKSRDFEPLPLNLIRKFASQILHALALLRTLDIIHCDLKPENILLTDKKHCDVKLSDFGTSCFSNEQVFTYLQSRFYRAPEVILGVAYTPAIDMWSLGCTLAELFMGYPLFPGKTESEQLELIIRVFGYPPKNLIKTATRKDLFFGNDNKLLAKHEDIEQKDFAFELGCCDKDFVDFLKRCLEWEASKRITPEEALKHPWIARSAPLAGSVRKVKAESRLAGKKKTQPRKCNSDLDASSKADKKSKFAPISFKANADKVKSTKKLKEKIVVQIKIEGNKVSTELNP
eukprot:TRINITY_DN2885_c0_g2_i1.p1 TRINITY_DN2885_c0_g2~~TRINITY_DN2885_c0_g2_i1.p1  ORF type:complete len:638 (-),score=121.43 TRINITY_DN2885_c0_g2_i1:1085-2998(-)